MQCPMCKQEHAAGIRFCPNDGTPLTETSSAARTVSTPAGGRPPSRELELPVVVGNRYKLLELRGGGGMAKVYRGTDLTLEREVAVKLMNPELRVDPEFDARFQREAKIASQLTDPHIVEVYDFGIDPDLGPFLVMQFLHGQSLRERLATSGKLPFKAALQMATQLIQALLTAHQKGIVHRDIKPDNVFLHDVSGVKLHTRVLDFGIARIYRGDTGAPGGAGSVTITVPGSVLGTPRYMSPEQLAGQPVDARSDLYSAAIVVFESMTNQLPYVSGKKLCELCPEATQNVQDLLEQCLKPSPAERPPNAVEVYLRLAEIGRASGILNLPPGAMEKIAAARSKANEQPTIAYTPGAGAPLSRRRWLIVGGAALVVLAGLGVGGYLLFGRHKPGGTEAKEESLAGIKVGEDRDDVVKAKNLRWVAGRGSPWQRDDTLPLLGHVLKPADLKLAPGELAQVEVYTGKKDRDLCVLFHDRKVVAVVASQSGASTAREVSVGGDWKTVATKYEDGLTTVELPQGKGLGYRCGPRGLGFEIKGHTIIRIALFPPVKADEKGP